MKTMTYKGSTGTMNLLDQRPDELCRSGEVTWLPVTWGSVASWRLRLHPKAVEKAFFSVPLSCCHKFIVKNARRGELWTGNRDLPGSLSQQCVFGQLGRKLNRKLYRFPAVFDEVCD